MTPPKGMRAWVARALEADASAGEPLTRGAVVAGVGPEDEWMVVNVHRRSVVLVCLTLCECWEWALCDDGIQVAQLRVQAEHDREWVSMPINSYPPPAAVERHLRPKVVRA